MTTHPASAGSPHASMLAGLIGAGIAGSRSPEMHQSEARALGLPMVYRIIDGAAAGYGANDLPELLRWLAAAGFDGVNVTHPFKQAVLPHLDTLSDAAQALQAVNTILFRDGKTHGENTDWSGYCASFLRGLGDRPRRDVAMIGAGGAASAAGYAHLDLGAERLRIHDPAASRAYELAERLAMLFPTAVITVTSDPADAVAGADGIVQASPVGMASHPGLPFDPTLLDASQWVSEIIYFPLRTALLDAASTAGCATLDGGGMAVMQAAHAFRLFTGVEPDTDRMLATFAQASQIHSRPSIVA